MRTTRRKISVAIKGTVTHNATKGSALVKSILLIVTLGGGGGGGGRGECCCCQTDLFLSYFPCSADAQAGLATVSSNFFGLANKSLNVRNNSNNMKKKKSDDLK